jgi:Flp pilus assembly protein TadD
MTSTAPRIAVARSAPGAAGRPEPSTVAPPITVTRPQPRLDPAVEEAYNAFQAGDLTRAQELYQRAAQSDPTNRDVQLGLAAIDLRSDRINNAEARYARLLELDPRDPHAQAGIAAIRGGADPIQSESRLKTMIAQQPDAGLLHFALGNQYAAQLRWSEAQQEYFRAFTSDPENPDFAFNLAVSLDQIRQPKLALEYYQRALNLANARPSAFDRTRVSTRVQELQR